MKAQLLLYPELSRLSWVLCAMLVFFLPKLWRAYRRGQMTPPGPRGLPIVGNLLQVPLSMQWIPFTEWSKKFGPICSINLFGQPIVIVSSFKVATELFDRRSNLYSDRPKLIMAGEIMTRGLFIILSRYGSLWKNMRRATHEAFNLRAVERFRPLLAKEAATVTLRMLDSPDLWMDHIRKLTASAILGALYDWPSISEKDATVLDRIYAHGTAMAEAVVPGAFIVDIFPFLNYLPSWITKWKRDGDAWHMRETAMFQGFMNDAQEKIISEGLPPCFVRDLVEQKSRHKLSDKEAAWLTGVLFLAGYETTASTLGYFMHASVRYPKPMERAKEEIDRVVGRDRLPTFDDIEHLPYIQALVKELLRWRPILPLAVPRTTTEDDWYQGYLIPKGSIIFANVWAMNRDPELFPDFDEFRPERFLKWTPEETHNIGHGSYGFGKRICVGQHFANQILHVVIATCLWGLDIEKALDKDGHEILPPKKDFIEKGAIVEPVDFKCQIFPRSPNVVTLMERRISGENL